MQKRHDTIIDPEIKILQSEEAFCYSTDTLLLFDFINSNYDFEKQTKALELGSGTGGLCIALAKRYPAMKIAGIDIQPKLVELSKESAALNSLENVEFKNIDLRSALENFYPETFNLVMTNPPYFKLGTGRVNSNLKKAQAKHEIKCTLYDIFRAASYLLKKTGMFFLIHHYSRIFDVFDLASQFKLKLSCFRPVYLSRSKPSEDATHGLFAFSRSNKKEPRILAPCYIRE